MRYVRDTARDTVRDALRGDEKDASDSWDQDGCGGEKRARQTGIRIGLHKGQSARRELHANLSISDREVFENLLRGSGVLEGGKPQTDNPVVVVVRNKTFGGEHVLETRREVEQTRVVLAGGDYHDLKDLRFLKMHGLAGQGAFGKIREHAIPVLDSRPKTKNTDLFTVLMQPERRSIVGL